MHTIITKHIALTVAIVGMAGLGACQSVQPFDGQSGYQREASNNQEVVLSYTLDAKSSAKTIQHKLQKACAQELGLTKGTLAQFKTLYEKEFVNMSKSKNAITQQTVPIGNSQRASFSLSSTPKLSNTDSTSSMHMLDSKPSTLKRITVQCVR